MTDNLLLLCLLLQVDYGDPNEPAQPSIEAQDAQQHAPADSSKSEPQPAGTSSGLLEDSGTGKRHPRAPIPLYQPRDRKGNKADAEDPPAQLTGASPTADKAAKLASVKPVAVAASVGKSAPSPGAIRRAASPLPEAPPAKIATPVPGTETAAIMIENLVGAWGGCHMGAWAHAQHAFQDAAERACDLPCASVLPVPLHSSPTCSCCPRPCPFTQAANHTNHGMHMRQHVCWTYVRNISSQLHVRCMQSGCCIVYRCGRSLRASSRRCCSTRARWSICGCLPSRWASSLLAYI